MSSEDLEKAMQELGDAQKEGVNLILDSIRRRALYPTLASMEPRTREIMLKYASIPINETNQEIEHLLRHIDMLKKEIRK
jgi:hypothetical protein